MNVAIQGITGSFHEQAALSLFGASTNIVSCEHFRDVFTAVQNGDAERGVVAIENSLHGPINPVYRLLSSENLWICSEVRLHIQMYLAASAKVKPALPQIKRVISQLPALEQCENWLNTHIPDAIREEANDTAASVQLVASKEDPTLAAIGSMQAIEAYGATVLAGPINDDPHNYTRFVCIAKQSEIPAQANRTSIILTEQRDTPGALYAALGYFKEEGVNLSKLDSHPLPGAKRKYAFYVDYDIAANSNSSRRILKKLEADGWDVQILGSYIANDRPAS